MVKEIPSQPPAKYDVYSPDFDMEIGKRLLIRLNGVEQLRVSAYDCEAGTVKRYRTDDAGDILVNQDTGDAEKEILTGHVTVEWKAPVKPSIAGTTPLASR